MRLTSYHYCFVIPLLIMAIVPSIVAGGIIQPSEPGKTVSGGYWSNQITGPDYAVPESAFNPPDRGDWDAWYGGFASGGQDTGVMPSPYRYGSPGGLLPFDEDESLTPNTGTYATEVLPVSPYPRVITPVPVSPFAPGTMAIPVPVVPYLPAADIPPSSFSGQPALIIFPTADLSVLPDTGNGTGTSSGDAGTEDEPVIAISDLDVHEEYVKITNHGLTPVSLTGWKVMSGSTRESITFIDWPLGNGQTFTFTLYPLTTVTIHYGKSGTVTATDLYWPSARDAWNDAGDTAFLYDSDGHLVSSLSR